MFRFRGAAPALKPEGALKRAEELLGVGQKQNALQTLHDTITNKRHQRNWNKAFEQVQGAGGRRMAARRPPQGPLHVLHPAITRCSCPAALWRMLGRLDSAPWGGGRDRASRWGAAGSAVAPTAAAASAKRVQRQAASPPAGAVV